MNELLNSKLSKLLPSCRDQGRHENHRAQGTEVKNELGFLCGGSSAEDNRNFAME